MFSFDFCMRTKILFQADGLNLVGQELKQLHASKVLLVTDQGLVRTGLINRVTKMLSRQEIEVVIYDKVEPNPTISIIHHGYNLFVSEQCQGLLAIGGGSSIDTAKGIAILATNKGHISDYFGAYKVNLPTAPVIAIPTTAGTGSEVSTQISVKDDKNHSKSAIRSFFVQPAVAILDPTLLETLPAKIAAETGMDTLTHLIEGYVSKGASPLTDTLALRGIELVGRYLTAFVASRKNAEAASNMLLAAMIGGIVLSHARTGAAHTITRPMGDGISHGLANAVMLPYVMEFNLMSNVKKFTHIAKALGENVEHEGFEDAKKSISHVKRLNEYLGIPSTLHELGIKTEQLHIFAEMAVELDISKLNPRDLGVKEIEHILNLAF